MRLVVDFEAACINDRYAEDMIKGLKMRNMTFHTNADIIKDEDTIAIDTDYDAAIVHYPIYAHILADAGIPVIVINTHLNRDCKDHKNITKVDNWWEVFQQLVKIQARWQ